MSSFIFDKNYQTVSWKGKTFNQITTTYQQNKNTGKANLFNAGPVKQYRKEIAINDISSCSRSMISIDEINRPGGSIIAPDGAKNYYGLVNVLDFNLTYNSYERPGICNMNDSVNLCPAANAKRRVRSSGMIKKNTSTLSKNYYTNSQQYLQSRTKTFSQNQFNYIKLGDPNAKPGDPASQKNTYYPNSPFTLVDSSCVSIPPVYYKPSNSEFARQGGVSSSERTARKIYNTITSNASLYRKAYGSQVADALAYGVPTPGYTIKDAIGYPNTKTPVITADGTLRSCDIHIYRM
jgi:hypothetical protein